jgi:hypothetical protein
MTLPTAEAPANFVPAAAVIRRGRVLFNMTRRTGHVGGFLSPLSKDYGNAIGGMDTIELEYPKQVNRTSSVVIKYKNTRKTAKGEGN